jgi:hypothetical protein
MSFTTAWGHGHHLTDRSQAKDLVAAIDRLESIQAGDTILLRSSVIDGDYLYDAVPTENRRHLAGALAAPLTTLYVPQKPLRVVILSLSNASTHPFGPSTSGLQARAGTADLFEPGRFYTPELAARLEAAPGQFWLANDGQPSWNEFMTCFLPWLARQTGHDLKVASYRKVGHYFNVPADAGPSDFLDRLSNSRIEDFSFPTEGGPSWSFVLVQRQPLPVRVLASIGALANSPAASNLGTAFMAIWLFGQSQAPRVATAAPP